MCRDYKVCSVREGCLLSLPLYVYICSLYGSCELVVVQKMSFHLLIEHKASVAFFALYLLLLCVYPLMSFDQAGIHIFVLATWEFADEVFSPVHYFMGCKVRLPFKVLAAAVMHTNPRSVFFVFLHVVGQVTFKCTYFLANTADKLVVIPMCVSVTLKSVRHWEMFLTRGAFNPGVFTL